MMLYELPLTHRRFEKWKRSGARKRGLKELGLRAVSRFVSESLAADAFERGVSAFCIVEASRFPMVVSEIELSDIPLKVLFSDMMVSADQTALEKREKTLDGVGMHVAANVLVARMVDGAVLAESTSSGVVDVRLVGHQMRSRRSLGAENRLDVFRVDVRNVERASDTIALNKRNDLHLMLSAAFGFAPFDVAPVGFIGLNDSAFTASSTSEKLRSLVAGHCLADAVSHEPCGAVLNSESAV